MKKLYTALLFGSLICNFHILHSQTTFMKHYGGVNEQQGYAVHQCFDGGYVACGYARSSASTSSTYNYYLLRIDSMGDTLWTHKYYSPENRVAFDVIQTHDSCFVMCGYRGYPTSQVHLFKVDANGDSLWASEFGNNDWGQSLVETPDHGFMIAGSDFFRTDSNGVLIWNTTNSVNQYMSVVTTPDGGYAMLSSGSWNIYLTRTDSAGDTLWTKAYPGALYNPTNHMLITTSDGGYAICGVNTSYTAYFIKTDSVGDTLWTRNIFGYYGAAVAETMQGGYAVASSDPASEQIYLTVMDSLGNLLHIQDYGWNNSWGSLEWVQSLAPANDGGFIICGTTNSFYMQATDLLLIKTDSTGYAIGVGVNEYVVNNDMTVFPNPAQSRATIHFNQTVLNGMMEIYSSTGRLVRTEENITGNAAFVERKNLEAGIYIVVIRDEARTIGIEKIIFTL